MAQMAEPEDRRVGGFVIILMGVSGAGKSTVGARLAQALGWTFLDGDELHPARNREMMSHGIALTDADRQPWLAAVRQSVERFLSNGANAVIACSALKESYRRRIVVDPSRVKVVYLKGPPELIASRLRDRSGHFMRPELLQSQFDALEEPRDAIVVEISASPDAIVASIRAHFRI
jgi:gluconokinase